MSHRCPDVRFRSGNDDPLHGRDAVRAAVTSFWITIAELKHHLVQQWDVEGDTTIVRLDVDYLRHDGQSVTVPNIDILRYRDGLVVD